MSVKPLNVFDSRECRLGEGPHYDERTDRVYWVDILNSLILWRTFDGSDSGSIHMAAHIGAVVPRANGGLAACLPEGILDINSGDWLARYPGPTEGLRSNDAKADPRGRLWHGTMAYDEGDGRGSLYRLDPGTSETRLMLPAATVSNGMGWSPDGQTMYYIDSPTRRVDAFDFDMDTGTIEGRRPFVTIGDGFPDGMCVDAEGGVWVAIWLGHKVIRYLPDGSADRVLELPVPKVTCPTFAGPALDTLIVTTVGPTYSFQIDDVRGTPVDRFAG
ncbi:MAG TPA: SMP-30/gluconolactonase/LRE family protein [Candidatus Limnocylindrales bacterium]|nr:SMP-30/gluconolactonase/LRE family protein [Candidatus Limnocylindrales bacterium]